ncbi:MAE_28990/MAE_18760 family HEPN-like nuclease [Streptomyces sp. WAC 06738]|uniref:MAE_28990/MAE_18760 family HEPN-like nuclease n=1 Tax=Streptomyces sp. WAC 06738 TaxID=2203210 RepID=UPI000F7997A3|nr:MAE_28990/MAE_18760 family HEPN-like nuclease [Streptomyces sp. WAC 06738]
MKIRTTEGLYDCISADLGWRKKELSIFKGQVGRAEAGIRPALLRASIALLYAHWEGFVKNGAHAYLCYLASLKLTYAQLRPELVALAMRAQIEEFELTNRAFIHATLIRDVREGASSRAKIPTRREAVRTFSNLNYDRLCDILCSVGCDFSRYSPYQDLIDEQLLAARNRIAHGEEDYIRLTDWDDVRVEIIKMMDDISSQILNSATQKSYLLQQNLNK